MVEMSHKAAVHPGVVQTTADVANSRQLEPHFESELIDLPDKASPWGLLQKSLTFQHRL